MKALIKRTKMATNTGREFAYDIYIPASDVPHANQIHHYTLLTGKDGKHEKFVTYVDATMPANHYAMPQGFKRYDHYLAHEKKCKREMWALVQSTFPETRNLPIEEMPLLWVSYDEPQFWKDETRTVSI